MEGWIKLHKKIVKHWLWADANRLKWWIDLLIMAAYEDTEIMVDGRLVKLKRGQLCRSIRHLAKRWKAGRDTVSGFLNLCQGEGMISRHRQGHQITIITICKYEEYQVNELEMHATNKATNKATDKATDKATMTKEIQENKNNYYYSSSGARTREELTLILITEATQWIESLARFIGGICQEPPDMERARREVEDFIEFAVAGGMSYNSQQEARMHCRNYIAKRLNIEQERKNEKQNGYKPIPNDFPISF